MKIFNSINDVRNWADGCFQNSLSADQIARAAVAVDSLAFRQGIAFGQDWEPVLAGITIDQLTEWAGLRAGFYETPEEIYQVDPDGTIHCMLSPDLAATGGRPVEVDELPEGAVWSDHQRQAALLCAEGEGE